MSPIAIKARDLDGNALLAFAAAERGFGVILGSSSLTRKAYTPRGIVVEKNLRPGKGIRRVSELLAERQKVAAWCDEGLIYKDAETYRRLKFDPEAYRMVDLYFPWGNHQAVDLVESLGCAGDKLRISGNPRFDIHRPDVRAVLEDRADSIRRRHGRYILINTKFATFNGFAGSGKNIAEMRARGMLHTAEHEREANALRDFQGSLFTEFMQLTEELSRQFPELTIVVRPHPSENHEPWRKKAATLPNVKVVYEGNVAEWIVGSEICIHNNCTTGVEAYLLGKPSISFRPVSDPRFDLFLPCALSSETFELAQLMEVVAQILNGEGSPGPGDTNGKAVTARQFIANMDGKWACDSILDALESIDVPELPLSFEIGVIETATLHLRRNLAPLGRLGWSKDAVSRHRFTKQKFGALPEMELLSLLKSARKATGRFSDVQISTLEDGIVCIY